MTKDKFTLLLLNELILQNWTIDELHVRWYGKRLDFIYASKGEYKIEIKLQIGCRLDMIMPLRNGFCRHVKREELIYSKLTEAEARKVITELLKVD